MQTITQTHFVNATPEEVFLAITNPLTIELWSGYPAVMEATENFEFSLFEGEIAGRNIKVVPGQQVVQEWYFGDHEEQSIVTIDLTPAKNKTRVDITHTNVPDEVFEEFKEGWRNYYWRPIIDFFK